MFLDAGTGILSPVQSRANWHPEKQCYLMARGLVHYELNVIRSEISYLLFEVIYGEVNTTYRNLKDCFYGQTVCQI